MEFLDIVPEWPGSQHDSRIFQNSRLYMRYMQGELTGALVGDAGYPALPFLFTPIGNPVSDEEQRLYYIIGNTSDIHIFRFINENIYFPAITIFTEGTRGIVERTFGT